MTLTDFFRDLQKETAVKIRHAEASEKDVLRRAYWCVSILTEANTSLKAFVINYLFENAEEEIWFFKHAKPALISQYIYHCQVYNIEMDRPVGGMNIQRDYLDKELENLQDWQDAVGKINGDAPADKRTALLGAEFANKSKVKFVREGISENPRAVWEQRLKISNS